MQYLERCKTHKISRRAHKHEWYGWKRLKLLRRKKRVWRKEHASRPKPKAKGHIRLDFLRSCFGPISFYAYDIGSKIFYIKVPKVFSILDNTDETLKCIAALLSIPSNQANWRIYIDQGDCEKMDLAANAVFDVCAMMLREEQRSILGKAYPISGKYPKAGRLRDLAKSLGITRHLNIPGAEASPDFLRKITEFPLKHGKRRPENSSFQQNDQERVSTELARHLDICFQKASGFRLTDSGQALVANWAGEIITNAEEHSGNSDWYAMSYMARIPPGDDGEELIGECELLIFNFGLSIFESLSSEDTSEALRESIQSLVDKHTRFGFFRPQYCASDLWTLYSLQDGISRFSPGPGFNDRGRGTVQLIEAFQELGHTADGSRTPAMVLISGKTKIIFDDQYKMKEQKVDGGARRIIAFNTANSLDDKPDARNVMTIDGFFPGTLIALRFYLDRKFLTKIEHPPAKV